MKKIALLTLLLINLSLSFSLPRNQASPAIFSVTKTNNSILFRHTDSTLTAIPCQSVASIVSNADPSKIVSVWVVQQGDYDKIMQFDYLVCGFSSKSDAVDSLTAWAICDTSSGGGGGVGDVSQSALDDSLTNVYTYINNNIPIITDSATITDYTVINSQNAPPGSPATGDIYLVGNSPSGAWVGQAKDIAEWNGSAWVFTDGVQGDFLYNATNALTYIFRSGNWVQTTGIPALNNGNTISSGLRIGTNNARSLTFETNNVNRGRFDSVGRFYVYDTSLRKSNKYLQIDSITGRLVASEISGSGGGALSSLTAATATNIINNGNFQQEWQWNSLANNTGFKLSSTSGGLLNTQNRLFEVQMSGAMPTSGSSSYAGYFKNTQTGGSGIGLYAEGTLTAINAVGIINTSTGFFINNDFSLTNSAGGSNVKAAASARLNLRGDNLINFQNIDGTINYASINNITDNVRQSLLFNGVYTGGLFYCSATTSAMVERSSDKLIFSANSGLTANTSFTPNNIMTVYGTNSNVGIGTTTPVASAKLEVSSTTSGFLPPRMTATQASAISTPAQGLLLFVSDTNGTFTSVGWWGYNGSTWEKLNN